MVGDLRFVQRDTGHMTWTAPGSLEAMTPGKVGAPVTRARSAHNGACGAMQLLHFAAAPSGRSDARVHGAGPAVPLAAISAGHAGKPS